MSGIYIHGMEMPKSCDECPCFSEYDACDVTGSWKFADEFDKGKARLPDCPLVSVPPHGRLIDADFLLAEYDKIHVGKPGGARLLIANAPTIIPAEEGEG